MHTDFLKERIVMHRKLDGSYEIEEHYSACCF